MTLFNADYILIKKMPFNEFEKILNWRVKYEQEKAKQMEAEMKKTKVEKPR